MGGILRAWGFPTERVLSRTPLIIRTVDQKEKTQKRKGGHCAELSRGSFPERALIYIALDPALYAAQNHATFERHLLLVSCLYFFPRFFLPPFFFLVLVVFFCSLLPLLTPEV